jgi:hypothetical protein
MGDDTDTDTDTDADADADPDTIEFELEADTVSEPATATATAAATATVPEPEPDTVFVVGCKSALGRLGPLGDLSLEDVGMELHMHREAGTVAAFATSDLKDAGKDRAGTEDVWALCALLHGAGTTPYVHTIARRLVQHPDFVGRLVDAATIDVEDHPSKTVDLQVAATAVLYNLACSSQDVKEQLADKVLGPVIELLMFVADSERLRHVALRLVLALLADSASFGAIVPRPGSAVILAAFEAAHGLNCLSCELDTLITCNAAVVMGIVTIVMSSAQDPANPDVRELVENVVELSHVTSPNVVCRWRALETVSHLVKLSGNWRKLLGEVGIVPALLTTGRGVWPRGCGDLPQAGHLFCSSARALKELGCMMVNHPPSQHLVFQHAAEAVEVVVGALRFTVGVAMQTAHAAIHFSLKLLGHDDGDASDASDAGVHPLAALRRDFVGALVGHGALETLSALLGVNNAVLQNDVVTFVCRMTFCSVAAVARAATCGVVPAFGLLLAFGPDEAPGSVHHMRTKLTMYAALVTLVRLRDAAPALVDPQLRAVPQFMPSLYALAWRPCNGAAGFAEQLGGEAATVARLSLTARKLLRGLEPTLSAVQCCKDGATHQLSMLKCAVTPDKCVICVGGEDTAQVRLPCLHTYHMDCIKEWIHTRGKCPLCSRWVLPDILSLVATAKPVALLSVVSKDMPGAIAAHGAAVAALTQAALATVPAAPAASAVPALAPGAGPGSGPASAAPDALGVIHCVADATGVRWYDEDGRLHRADGEPAQLLMDGTRQWYHHGVLYRQQLADGTVVEVPGADL